LDGQVWEVRRRRNSEGQNLAGQSYIGQSQQHNPIQQYEYNARGQIVGIVDGVGEKIGYDLDSWGRITSVKFSDGVKEGYEYTPSGQVKKAIDGNGNAVQYLYNSFGKVRERIDQTGEKETFQYDEEGNLQLYTDRDGNQVYRLYNVLGKPVYEKATDKNGENPCLTTFRYDSMGRLVQAVGNGHSYEYEYNEQGYLKEKRSSGKRLISYEYDNAGNIICMTDPAGVKTCYSYDLLGRTSRIYNGNGLEVQYDYDCQNRIEKIFYGNGIRTRYEYDRDGNLAVLETKADEKVLFSLSCQYDGNGNRVEKKGIQRFVGNEIVPIHTTYQYDIRGQLLEENHQEEPAGAIFRYGYDACGNRIEKEENSRRTVYTYNGKNQLVTEESAQEKIHFTYNQQGSMISREGSSGISRFFYNSKNQQIRTETEDGQVQENRYDVEGLRYEVRENANRIWFVYHQGELLYEKGGEESSYHQGGGIEAVWRSEKNHYYHQDEQLRTAFITNEKREIQNHYQYDAFGNGISQEEGISNRIRYTGQQYDGVTGQYYLRARYYNPILGRFLQEDVYQGDGLNLYAYCGNNPVRYYDPSGYSKTPEVYNTGCPGAVTNGDAGQGERENQIRSDSETKRQTPDQKALRDLAKEAEKAAKKGSPISENEAKILDDWADEYGVPQHHKAYIGSGEHFKGGNYSDHTHIYNIHVPYKSVGGN
jgi:RHS repeat-associated protein